MITTAQILYFAVFFLELEKPFSFPAFYRRPKTRNLAKAHSTSQLPNMIRPLPAKIIAGYTKHCDDSVFEAVKNGINVIIWCFMEFVTSEECLVANDSVSPSSSSSVVVKGGPSIESVRSCIRKIDDMGHNDVVHLTSFGGWNGPHLNTMFSAEEMYNAWKSYGGDVFHGFDWDLEGNDNVNSPRNELTLDCLDSMGRMSELAKRDGYIVGIAPAESYLDISTSRFSRFLNLTYPDDDWHHEFTYHGANSYAYLIAKYEEAIDFISVQFYESYSHAAYNITQLGIPASEYIVKYVSQLAEDGERYYVDFNQDKTIGLESQFINVPLNKLVIGLANGWADGKKTVYISPNDVGKAYKELLPLGYSLRGFMFWCMEEEGRNGIYFASGINNFMNTKDHIYATSINTKENE